MTRAQPFSEVIFTARGRPDGACRQANDPEGDDGGLAVITGLPQKTTDIIVRWRQTAIRLRNENGLKSAPGTLSADEALS